MFISGRYNSPQAFLVYFLTMNRTCWFKTISRLLPFLSQNSKIQWNNPTANMPPTAVKAFLYLDFFSFHHPFRLQLLSTLLGHHFPTTYFVWLRITDEGSVPEMRIWSILLIKYGLKWYIHLIRSLCVYFSANQDWEQRFCTSCCTMTPQRWWCWQDVA